MSTINSVGPASYPLSGSTSTPTDPSASTAGKPTLFQQDEIDLSLAGRIALGLKDGGLTSAQGEQLFSQLKTITQSIKSGASDSSQLESQLSQQIYGDGHNGAPIPAGLTVSPAEVRDLEQAGRIVTQEDAGKLTSSQADQFYSQILKIDQESQTGASASATNQAQNQLSAEIFDAANGIANVPAGS